MNEETRKELIKTGAKIRTIRLKYRRTSDGRPYTQADFAKLFNETEPLNITTTPDNLCRIENGDLGRITVDKLAKFLSLAKIRRDK